MKLTHTHFACALLGLAMPAQAATLALFSNDAVNGTASFADEASAANVTVSALVFDAAPDAAKYSNGAYSTYTGTALEFIASNFAQKSTLDSSNATDRFAVFSMSAAPGYAISLNTSDVFAYTVGGNTIGNAYAAEATSLAYVSDQSDFSNILFESTVATCTADTTSDGGRWRGDDYTLNPTGTGSYQTLYFALELAVSNNTSNGTKAAMVGEMSFDGSVIQIPEPSSAALLGLGGLALILRRRKA